MDICLGPTTHYGDATTYYILTDNNKIFASPNVRPDTGADMINHSSNTHFMDEGYKNHFTIIQLMLMTHRTPPQCFQWLS